MTAFSDPFVELCVAIWLSLKSMICKFYAICIFLKISIPFLHPTVWNKDSVVIPGPWFWGVMDNTACWLFYWKIRFMRTGTLFILVKTTSSVPKKYVACGNSLGIEWIKWMNGLIPNPCKTLITRYIPRDNSAISSHMQGLRLYHRVKLLLNSNHITILCFPFLHHWRMFFS